MAGIYLHIPFCKKRCIYCDFYSTTREEKKEDYVDALCKELKLRSAYLGGEKINTLYLGGGTPSQLNEAAFGQLFRCMEKHYDLSECREITIEANPDDLNEEYIRMLRKFPFDRLSMGVQTFHEEKLQFLRRRHTAQQAIEAVRRCQKAGFTNLSIDLIYGLPGETLKQWLADLQQAIDMKVPHISAYHLIYEEGTPLWQLKQQRQMDEMDEELSLKLFYALIDTLTAAGYQQYEISNFALPGCRSRHNSGYWTGEKYLGCGAAAHSYDGHSRQWNIADLDEYIQQISNGLLPFEKEELNVYTRYNERIITSLRTMWGLSLIDLRNEFGNHLYLYCQQNASPYLQQGYMEQTDDTLRLTRKGLFVSNGIMSALLWIEA